MSVFGIFQTPISIVRLDKEKISKELNKIDMFSVVERVGETKTNSSWDCNCYTGHNENKISLEDSWAKVFLEEVSVAVIDYINSIKIDKNSSVKFNINCPWINMYNKGDFQEIHHHIGSNNIISFTYFHKLPKDSGKFCFSMENDSKVFIGQNDSAQPELLTAPRNRYVPNVEEGDLVIFPSYLQHFVTPNNSNETRITIAGNIQRNIT